MTIGDIERLVTTPQTAASRADDTIKKAVDCSGFEIAERDIVRTNTGTVHQSIAIHYNIYRIDRGKRPDI